MYTYTVFDEESECQIENNKIRRAEAKIKKNDFEKVNRSNPCVYPSYGFSTIFGTMCISGGHQDLPVGFYRGSTST